MALTFTSTTFDTRTVNVIDIGTDELILESALSKFDQEHLEAAMAAGLGTYTMPNGQVTADVYFAPFVRSAAEITTQYANARIKSGSTSAISGVEGDIATITSTFNTHTHAAGAVPDQTI